MPRKKEPIEVTQILSPPPAKPPKKVGRPRKTASAPKMAAKAAPPVKVAKISKGPKVQKAAAALVEEAKPQKKRGRPARAIRIGSAVRWESPGRGVMKLKVGSVLERIPAGKTPEEVGLAKRLGAQHARLMWSARARAREKESFLVLVPGPSQRAIPSVYWPPVEKLRAVTGAA